MVAPLSGCVATEDGMEVGTDGRGGEEECAR